MLGTLPVSSGNTPNITPLRSNTEVNNTAASTQPNPNVISADQVHLVFNLLIEHSDAMLDALEGPKPGPWDNFWQWLTSFFPASEEPSTDKPEDTQYFLLSYLRKNRDNPSPNQPSTDFKFDPNVPNHKGEYLLMRAAKSGQYPNAIRKLIVAGANLNIQDKNGRTPLMHAILSGDDTGAIRLIEAGARLEIVDKNQQNALHHTVMENTNKNIRIAKAILQKHEKNRPSDATERTRYNKTLYQQPDKQGRIPLTVALINRVRFVAEPLVPLSGNWNKPDEDGYTPLMYAAMDEHNEALVRPLITHGADCRARDKKHLTPLMHAAAAGADGALSALAGGGPNHVKAQDLEGKTPLMHLVIHQQDSQVRKMIWKLCLEGMGNEGTNALPGLLNQRDHSGKTAMMHAAEHGNIEAIRKLREISTNTDLDLIDQDGNTALIHAAQNNQPEAVFELCKMGANPNIKNQAGKSAYQIAEQMDFSKVLQGFQTVRHQKTEHGLSIVIEDYPESLPPTSSDNQTPPQSHSEEIFAPTPPETPIPPLGTMLSLLD